MDDFNMDDFNMGILNNIVNWVSSDGAYWAVNSAFLNMLIVRVRALLPNFNNIHILRDCIDRYENLLNSDRLRNPPSDQSDPQILKIRIQFLKDVIKAINERINQLRPQYQQSVSTAIRDTIPDLVGETPTEIANFLGGKRTRKTKKVRKHRGIVQTGGNKGKLKKGYKYTGKRLKNGSDEIKKVKAKK
ncbi:MAG TPA: hypothetical protein QGF58_23645 [Myxococcota bacterium]|nr:hypothetical protein [Myxococcota bacterium]